MSTEVVNKRRRRARGSAKNCKPLYLTVDQESIDKIESAANALGLSKAATLDLLLELIQLERDGRPVGYDGPLATDLQEELPLQTAS